MRRAAPPELIPHFYQNTPGGFFPPGVSHSRVSPPRGIRRNGDASQIDLCDTGDIGQAQPPIWKREYFPEPKTACRSPRRRRSRPCGGEPAGTAGTGLSGIAPAV